VFSFVVFFSLFFSDRLASENGGGQAVLEGTPLRMPTSPEYKSFVKVINQLQDVDPPFIFGLPENIERSLQRTNSSILIRQLRILASSDAEASKYDREKWRAQVRHSLFIVLLMWPHPFSVFLVC
jgi:hypothetical protein